jgi:hypothetical protein
MKKTKNAINGVIVLCTILITMGANAQEFKDKFFFSNGFSIATETFFGRKILPPESYDPNSQGSYYNDDDYDLSVVGISYFTYTANFRYNLKEFNNNSSISLNVPVGLGLMFSEYGFGSINFPVFFSINTGNISTYSADKDKGFTFGVGFEYYNMALFKNPDYKDYSSALDGASWVEPAVNIGYRYWNKRNVAREFNLKLGFGPSISETINGVKYDYGSPLVIKLTWFIYGKY